MKTLSISLCVLLLSVSFVFADEEKKDCYSSNMQGKMDAELMYDSSGAFWNGFGWSLLLGGILGGAISIGSAALVPPSLHTVPVPENVDDACYRSGYIEIAKGKNVGSALNGALTGTGVLIVAALIIMGAAGGF